MNTSAPPDQVECDVLRRLRQTPRLLELAAQSSGDELAVQKRLREDFSADLVRVALQVHALRIRAAARFTRADRLWLDARGLEQATAEPVALHKAAAFRQRVRLAQAGNTGRMGTGDPPDPLTVNDFCCGIGSDAIALARTGFRVLAVDRSAAACLRTQWNADVYGVAERIEVRCADLRNPDLLRTALDHSGWLHIDPDRRPGASGTGDRGRSRRVLRIEDCEPGLDVLRELTGTFRGGAIKLSPASNFGGRFPGCEIELVSLDGECREATVWFGELAGPVAFRATVLPSGASLAADPLSAVTIVGPLAAWLYDPDPAVVRAGLVDAVAEQLGLHRLDDAEEYLTGASLVNSPFVRPFEVLENLPNNDRIIRRAVRNRKFGQVEIKCRHVPVDADAVRRHLPLEGTLPGTVIFTRQSGRTRVVLCRRV